MKLHPLPLILAGALGILSGTPQAAAPAAPVASATTAVPATSAELGGKERFAAYVSTDKPIYRDQETLYGRSVLLSADSHLPAVQQLPVQFEITGPKGDRVASGTAATEESVAGFYWAIPEGQPGGEYQLQVTCPMLGIAPAVRKFEVRAFRAPRLKTQIKFRRDGYGPGDTVNATVETTRAEGGVPENATVTISARVDGVEVHTATGVVDHTGHCTAIFKLPAMIERGNGTMVFAIADGGVVETASKTIPILLQTLDLAMYPEGGDLVAGLPCRLYLEGRTPAGKPADISGVVMDAQGAQVATFRTAHEGRARLLFTPVKGMAYSLKIVEPAGMTKTFPLPPVRTTGTLLRTTSDVYPKGEAIELRVLSTEPGPFTISLRKFETEVAALTVRGGATAGEESVSTVTLTPPPGADGVLVATVWNSHEQPVAERLLFREPAKSITVRVTADRPRYVPGAPVSLIVTTTDARGEPLAAVVGLTITDDSVLEMIDKREQAPRLPVMVLLEPEVRELADAHLYLDPANAKAPLAMDLLLGTQGWRRFALVNLAEFLEQNGDAGRRALAVRTAMSPPVWPGTAGQIDDDDGIMELAVARPAAARPGAAPARLREKAKPTSAAAERPIAHEAEADPDGPMDAAEARLHDTDDDGISDLWEFTQAPWVSIREYAHPVRPDRQPGERRDFTETLYWHAGIRTDAKTGQAKVSFALNDAVSSFRVLADAFTDNGALGAGSGLVESVQPFYVEPKLPLEVTMGDRIRLPLSVVNGTMDAFDGAALKLSAAKGLAIAPLAPFKLGPESRVRRLTELAVGNIAGEADFTVDATAGAYSDHVTRKLRVVPRGFPVTIAKGGMLGPNAALTFTINIPANRVPGSLSSDIAVYPTPMANLTKALERLLQEPCGCFEQTSSTTYPVVMVQQYFATHQGVDPKLAARGKELLKKGYERLTGFECKQQGYEWFGQDPGHETLSAYGLLEFTDMAQVYSVDAAMLQRTRQWLLAAKDGKGGFKRERRALHTWIEDRDCSNAYITWALLMAGEPATRLRAEIDTVKAAATKSENSYVVAIGANIALADKDADTAKVLLDRLAAKQAKDGYVDGGTATIVGSGGIALQVETTAYALLAWLQDKTYTGSVERGVKWLADVCEGGRYGSTQATVLALRAIVAYDKARSAPKAPGTLQLTVDGRQAGSAVMIGPDTTGAIVLTDIAELLEPGDHTVEIRMTGGSEMPCSVAVKYSNETPESSGKCKIGLTVALAADTVVEGKVTEANVTVMNRAEDEIIPTPVAIIGIPGGLEVRHDQLKELVKSGKIAAYEVIGREVVLYWRSLNAQETVQIPLSLVAAIPGSYTAPASRAYLYYTDEFKTWAFPLRVTVTAAE